MVMVLFCDAEKFITFAIILFVINLKRTKERLS